MNIHQRNWILLMMIRMVWTFHLIWCFQPLLWRCHRSIMRWSDLMSRVPIEPPPGPPPTPPPKSMPKAKSDDPSDGPPPPPPPHAPKPPEPNEPPPGWPFTDQVESEGKSDQAASDLQGKSVRSNPRPNRIRPHPMRARVAKANRICLDELLLC